MVAGYPVAERLATISLPWTRSAPSGTPGTRPAPPESAVQRWPTWEPGQDYGLIHGPGLGCCRGGYGASGPARAPFWQAVGNPLAPKEFTACHGGGAWQAVTPTPRGERSDLNKLLLFAEVAAGPDTAPVPTEPAAAAKPKRRRGSSSSDLWPSTRLEPPHPGAGVGTSWQGLHVLSDEFHRRPGPRRRFNPRSSQGNAGQAVRSLLPAWAAAAGW
jgi:hypothetical protein